MLESLKSKGGKRWPRGQKFVLSERGAAAEAAYREVIVGSRSSGRTALESAQQGWATPFGVQAGDGVILCELRSGKRSIAEVARALEDCGRTTADVKGSIDRLTDAGLVEPAAAPEAAAA
jgi:hypothetical protein